MKNNCHNCEFKRKTYKRVELEYYPAKFACLIKRENCIKALSSSKCNLYIKKGETK